MWEVKRVCVKTNVESQTRKHKTVDSEEDDREDDDEKRGNAKQIYTPTK
jgi:hypothetical protein